MKVPATYKLILSLDSGVNVSLTLFSGREGYHQFAHDTTEGGLRSGGKKHHVTIITDDLKGPHHLPADTIIRQEWKQGSLVLHFKGQEGLIALEYRHDQPDQSGYTGRYFYEDTNTRMIRSIDPVTGEERLMFEIAPIRHGNWVYYDDNGQVLHREKYVCGVLQPAVE